MNVVIVGMGLIGGSLALAMKEKFSGINLIGVDNSDRNCSVALELGLVNQIAELNDATEVADIIFLAIPVDAIREMLPVILDSMRPDAVVVDTGSTKTTICEAVKNHSKRGRFVATHPIAGTENNGPESAMTDLFVRKKCILCETDKNDDNALGKVKNIFSALGMEMLYMTPEEHDEHMAIVSHLSHISSFALGLTVVKLEKEEKAIIDLAGSGFSSTVRLAKSSPAMWTSIMKENAEYIEKALNEYIMQLILFRNSIAGRDSERIFELITRANSIKRILDAKSIQRFNNAKI